MQYSVRIPSGYQPRVNQALFNCGGMKSIHVNFAVGGKCFILVSAEDLDTVGEVFKRLELPFNSAIYSGNIKKKYKSNTNK